MTGDQDENEIILVDVLNTLYTALATLMPVDRCRSPTLALPSTPLSSFAFCILLPCPDDVSHPP